MTNSMAGSILINRLSASPTMVNCRSTPERKSASPAKSSNVLPAMKEDSSAHAPLMSYRNLSASSRIEQHPVVGNRPKEIRILDRSGLHQVDIPAEQVLEGEQQAEVA